MGSLRDDRGAAGRARRDRRRALPAGRSGRADRTSSAPRSRRARSPARSRAPARSRPAPGPFTRTSISRTPILMAASAAFSAARWAANGVDFREPLNPIVPADAQARISPLGSAMATMVLLKDAFTWATPFGTLRLTFFFFPPTATTSSPSRPSSQPRSSGDPSGSVRSSGSAGPAPGGSCGDACRGTSRCPSSA